MEVRTHGATPILRDLISSFSLAGNKRNRYVIASMDDSSKKALRALQRALGKSVKTDGASLYRASMDNARLSFMPDAVVRVTTDEDVGKVLTLANRFGVPVTARGAGSATTGATSPIQGGWVLDLTARKRIKIEAVQGIATVEVGATIEAVNEAAEKLGWFYPPDPSSKKYATVGGSIANNAGGLRGAKYGVTRDYVLGLEGFLPTGEYVKWGGPLKKYVSGYNLRDLWIGSEGTLGVITRAHLKLVPKPAAQWTCLAAFKDEWDAIRAALTLMQSHLMPSIMEFLDRQTVACTTSRLGRPVFAGVSQAALLLLEFDGDGDAVRKARKQAMIWAQEYAVDFCETKQAAKAEQLWEVRRTCSQAMFQMGDTKINEDIVVPARSYVKLLRYTLQLKRETGLATPTFGHIADGNFHVHIMYDRDDSEQLKRAEAAVHKLMHKVIQLGGAITGEHGIGLSKSPFLRLQHSAAEIQAMQAIKQVLDPNNILNPGKIFEPFKIWDQQPDYTARFPWQ